MKDPLGFLASQEGPLAVISFLKVLYLFQPPNLSWFCSPNKNMFTTKDLILCQSQAQKVLLPKNVFLLRVFGSNSRGHHNNLRDSLSSEQTKNPAVAVVKSSQPSWLAGVICDRVVLSRF